MKFKFELGQKVKSKNNGFSGTITSRSEDLFETQPRYWVLPQVDKEGKHVEGRWCSEGELVLTKK